VLLDRRAGVTGPGTSIGGIQDLGARHRLLALSYIGEAMVVGVADEEFGQRVAALVSLQEKS
jgi:acyl-CoA synthetase (AMP-forming)/AMP-acid ligase II